MTRLADRQRVNVAASRPRDQLIVVHSVNADYFNPDDYRGRLIRFAQSPTRINERSQDLRDRCESQFERDVLAFLLTTGWSVDAQYSVAGYRIDLTVEDLNSRRVAIECDGDSFHGPDQLLDDLARQRVLERLGWKFVRIRASEFYRDHDRSRLNH